MYDAKTEEKEKEKTKNEELKFLSIYEGAYYSKSRTESMVYTKNSYIPTETLFFK